MNLVSYDSWAGICAKDTYCYLFPEAKGPKLLGWFSPFENGELRTPKVLETSILSHCTQAWVVLPGWMIWAKNGPPKWQGENSWGQQGASSSGEFHLPGWWLLQLQLRSTTPFPAKKTPNRCTADELYGICNVAWHCNRTGLVKLSCDSWWHAKTRSKHKLLTCRLWWIEASMSFDSFLKWVWSKLQEEFKVTMGHAMGCTPQMMVAYCQDLQNHPSF